MNENWMFTANGISVKLGMKIKAKNGTLGLTSEKELVLLDDNGGVIDRAPASQVVFKFSSFLGDSIKINGNKFLLSFVPPMKTGPFAGSAGSGMAYGMRDDVKAGEQKRKEFQALIEKIQG